MPFAVGDLIDGHYRVEQRFAGGMGFVYIVLDEVVGKRFAIKQLSELHAENDVLRERFRREASTWLLLDYHPHIVQAHSYLPRDRQPMLILEFVDGPSLDVLLRVEKKLVPGQVLRYARQVSQALHHAHTRPIGDRGIGVMHRDLKPGNLLITRTNQMKVTDFGLAKIQGDAQLTSEGQYVGTVAYSSPEQLRAAGEVSKSSDVYSFGTVMYQMLTGQPPYRGASAAELYYAIQETNPRSVSELAPEVPRPFANIVMRCLEKKPADRYGDFLELDAALQALGGIDPAAADRACQNCGFLSRRSAAKCSVCGTAGRAPSSDASSLRAPAGWRCACGTALASSERTCPQCGRAKPPGTPDSDAAARSWPTQSVESDPILLVPDSAAPVAEDRAVWNLDAEKEYLVELKPGGTVLPWELSRAGYTVGRSDSMKIRLHDPAIAQYQLFLIRLPCGWLAMNPIPNSPMHVNGSVVPQRVLRPADLVRVGSTWLAFAGPNRPAEAMPPIPGRWQELVSPKAQTVESGPSQPTKLNAPTPTSCTLEIPGGTKAVSRGQPIRIGNSPLCELRVTDSATGPVQALVAWQADGPHIFSVAQRTVRLVGGSEVTDRLLRDGDVIQVGLTPILVRLEGNASVPPPRSTPVTVATRFALSVLTGDQKGQSALLPSAQPITIGRHSKCELVLHADTFVSRRHVQMIASETEVNLKDLGSRGGFFLNQTHYTESAVARLGDVLVIGRTSLLVHHELEGD